MDKTDLSQLIQELGDSLGLPQLELDELNTCWLTFDDALVCLEADVVLDRLTLYAPVADLPASEREGTLMTLLKANLFWRETDGGTLAVSEEAQKILLQLALPLGALNHAALLQHLEGFVMQCEFWSSRLKDLTAEQPDNHAHADVLAVGRFV